MILDQASTMKCRPITLFDLFKKSQTGKRATNFPSFTPVKYLVLNYLLKESIKQYHSSMFIYTALAIVFCPNKQIKDEIINFSL